MLINQFDILKIYQNYDDETSVENEKIITKQKIIDGNFELASGGLCGVTNLWITLTFGFTMELPNSN